MDRLTNVNNDAKYIIRGEIGCQIYYNTYRRRHYDTTRFSAVDTIRSAALSIWSCARG